MRRLLLAALLAVGVVSVAQAAQARLLDLRTVEKAFYDAKIPFSTEGPPPSNPYLVPNPRRSGPTSSLPKTFQSHIVGWAAAVNPTTFKSRTVVVFDRSAVATAFTAWMKRHCAKPCSAVFLTADNIAYYGSRFAAIDPVLAQLRRG